MLVGAPAVARETQKPAITMTRQQAEQAHSRNRLFAYEQRRQADELPDRERAGREGVLRCPCRDLAQLCGAGLWKGASATGLCSVSWTERPFWWADNGFGVWQLREWR